MLPILRCVWTTGLYLRPPWTVKLRYLVVTSAHIQNFLQKIRKWVIFHDVSRNKRSDYVGSVSRGIFTAVKEPTLFPGSLVLALSTFSVQCHLTSCFTTCSHNTDHYVLWLEIRQLLLINGNTQSNIIMLTLSYLASFNFLITCIFTSVSFMEIHKILVNHNFNLGWAI